MSTVPWFLRHLTFSFWPWVIIDAVRKALHMQKIVKQSHVWIWVRDRTKAYNDQHVSSTVNEASLLQSSAIAVKSTLMSRISYLEEIFISCMANFSCLFIHQISEMLFLKSCLKGAKFSRFSLTAIMIIVVISKSNYTILNWNQFFSQPRKEYESFTKQSRSPNNKHLISHKISIFPTSEDEN